MDLLTELTILVLAAFVGFEVISKVPNTLHTPLMSGTNAIHGIVVLGGLLVMGHAVIDDDTVSKILLVIAVIFGTINVVGGSGFLLNMPSMRSVTRKPPTTLIVPNAIAITTSTSSRKPSAGPITSRPPSSTMPWIALVPLISGVCNIAGTFEMTS